MTELNLTFFILDQLISGVIIGPLTALFWWGFWMLICRNLYPNDVNLRGYFCAIVGNSGLLLLLFTQNMWKRHVNKNIWWQWLLGYHIYNALLLLSNVFHWLGVWLLLDHFSGNNTTSYWACYVIGHGLLIFLQTSRTAQAPPNFLSTSVRNDNYFEFSTRFRVKVSFSKNFVYDAIFTVCIIHQLVVFYWRGVWGVLDIYLDRDSPRSAVFVGVLLSYAMIVLLCFLQPLFNLVARSRSDSTWLTWLLELIVCSLSNFTNVCLWRSTWLCARFYLLPDDPDRGNLIAVTASLLVTSAMCCGLSMTLKGAEIEGSSNAEDACYLPNRYLRTLLTDARLNKVKVTPVKYSRTLLKSERLVGAVKIPPVNV